MKNSASLVETLDGARAALTRKDWDIAESLANSALHTEPENEDARKVLAEAYVHLGKLQEAARCLESLLPTNPANESLLNFLASVYWRLGRAEEAETCCFRVIESNPRNAVALSGLALCKLAKEQIEEAVALFRKATYAAPEVPAHYRNLAQALERAGNTEGAVQAYRKLLSLSPNSPESLYNLADLLVRQATSETAFEMARRMVDPVPELSKIEESLTLIDKALALQPTFPKALCLRGTTLQHLGRHEEAAQCLRDAISLDPGLVEAYWRLSRSGKVTQSDLPFVEQMTALAAQTERPGEGRVLLHNALGKSLGDLGRYQESMFHYDEAHRIGATLTDRCFDHQALSDTVDAMILLFDMGFFQNCQDIGLDPEVPIFIVGMPRSGTTLAEQILSSHPQVYGGGELPYWPDRAREAVDLSAPALDRAGALSLGNKYIEILWKLAGGKQKVTDKNPFNFIYLGLLHALFPNARIIHCTRDPVDNCMSIYMAHFQFPQPYVHRKSDLVFAYREYTRLMEHWGRVLTPDRLFELPYEELVTKRKEWTGKLIHFCGLPWNSACLHPETNPRAVHTASQWQVRQSVYSSSIARSKRYEPWLGELLELRSTVPNARLGEAKSGEGREENG